MLGFLSLAQLGEKPREISVLDARGCLKVAIALGTLLGGLELSLAFA